MQDWPDIMTYIHILHTDKSTDIKMDQEETNYPHL